jgi:hypothetical protein
LATIIRGGRVGRVVRGQIAATDDPVAGIAEGNRNCARAGRTHERCVVRLPAVASISGGEDPCNGRRAGLATLSKAATRTISKRFPRASAISWSRPGKTTGSYHSRCSSFINWAMGGIAITKQIEDWLGLFLQIAAFPENREQNSGDGLAFTYRTARELIVTGPSLPSLPPCRYL